MTVRAARTFAGYQALFCDRLGRADFLKLSPEAVGLLFMLRLLADRAILMSRGTSNHGKIWDDQAERWWVGADAEAWFADLHPGRAQDVAGWMAELRRGGFVAGDFDEELVVSDFVEDDLRKAGNVRAVAFGERGVGVEGFSGAGGYDETGDGGGARGGRFRTPQAPAHRGGQPSPLSPAPMERDDAHGGISASVGGKGGLYSNNTHYGKQQTPNPQTQTLQTPYQTHPRMEHAANSNDGDGLRMEGAGERGDGDFYAKIHGLNIFSAAQFACRQNDVVFRKAFEARLNHYGEKVAREALEYVAIQVHQNPHSIRRDWWKDGHPIGGPLLWSVFDKFGESAGVSKYVKRERVGFK